MASEITETSKPTHTHTPHTQSSISNSHSIQITSICLNGDNFLRWSQSVHMYIHGRGKIGYLTGDKKEPTVDDPAHAT